MKAFNEIVNQFLYEYHENDIIGNTEKIYIDGVGDAVCKVDTGNNAFNVIHGIDIKTDGDEVEFTTLNNKRIKKKLIDNAIINIGSGIKEDRPVMLFNVKLGEKEYPNVKFTISDRTENSEPVLLGKDFLSILNKLIDINKDFTTS
jgi:hypothetical protein